MPGPLSIQLNTAVKTSVPAFQPNQLIAFRCADIQEGQTDKGKTIKFTWELVEPSPSTDPEKPIMPNAFGSKVFDTVFLYDKNTPPDQIPDRAIAAVAARQDAVLGTGEPDNKKGKTVRPPFNAECVQAMLGQISYLQFRPAKDDGTGQDIKSFTYPGDVKQA